MATINYGTMTADQRTAHNAAVLAKVTVNQGYVDAFKPALKAWRADFGSKPTPEMLTVGVLLGNKHQRPGVEGLSIAMLLRPDGCCSQTQYQLAAVPLTGKAVGPANNKRKALVLAKLFHETSAGKPATLWLTFMSGGVAALEKYQAAQIAAATANAPAAKPVKAKKAKAAPVADEPVLTVQQAETIVNDLINGDAQLPQT